MKNRGHIPYRRCIVCHKAQPKADMLRYVLIPSGYHVMDVDMKVDGRGLYICKDNLKCKEIAKKKGRLKIYDGRS